jgi:hypothetical protein
LEVEMHDTASTGGVTSSGAKARREEVVAGLRESSRPEGRVDVQLGVEIGDAPRELREALPELRDVGRARDRGAGASLIGHDPLPEARCLSVKTDGVGTGVASSLVGSRQTDSPDDGADEAESDADGGRCHEDTHGATLRLQHGDVDPDGEVVDRLRSTACEFAGLDLDEHLLGVARMVAASRALELAKRGPVVPG